MLGRARALALAVALAIASVDARKPVSGSSTGSSRIKPLNRRGLLGAFLPVLAMRPLATLAVSEYLPPGSETEEFKALDSRATEFERKQLAYRKEWQQRVEALTSSTTDEQVLAALEGLRQSFRKTGDGNLPEGVSRDAFLRTVRRKQRDMEAAGLWGKDVRLSVLDLKTCIDSARAPKRMGEVAFG